MKKIQDENRIYSFLKYFVDHHTRRGFKRFQVVGRENIPTDGACVFGSNHCNTLMDALALLASTKGKKVFIARGDIFNKPNTAKLLRWIKILPIFRMRDGIGAVRDKNGDTIEQAVDVIHDEVPLFLFPEAAHRTKHSLRPLSKGIFHIALEANRRFGNEKPVYIVPVGLEYGDYFRFRSTLLVKYGKPINVTELAKGRENENEAVIINELKSVLSQRMSELISFIPNDDEDYEAIWELTKIKAGKCPCALNKRLGQNQKNIAEIIDFKKKEPEKAKTLFDNVLEFTKQRKERKISVKTVGNMPSFEKMFVKTLLMLLGLPFYLAAAAITCPIWIVASFILNGLKDEAFRNTVNFGVELVMHPVISAVGITLLFCLAPWKYAVLGTVFLYFSYVFFLDYGEFLRLFISDWRWLLNKRLREEFRELGL